MKMGTDGQDHNDDEAKSQTEQCPEEEEKIETKADRRTVGLRCYQGNGENSEDEPSELGASVVASSEPVFLVPQLSSQPQYLDCDFDVELTAEVSVEDGSSLALLMSITPNVGYQKPGCILSGHFLMPPSPSIKRSSVECFLPSGSYPSWCSHLIQASGLMKPPCSLTTTQRVIEIAKSPLPSSPSNSPSSPSSAPSSPSSSPSSSSPGGKGTNYHEDEGRGHAVDRKASKGNGDCVSSTSSSFVPSLSVPSSSNPPLHTSASSTHPCNDGQREGVENDIYDPFYPTEGEGERERPSTEDEDEVDKYDPFEPTGSPASETEEEKKCMDGENEGGSSINSEGNFMADDRTLEVGAAAGTEGGPPDSTEIVSPSCMFNNVILDINSKQSIKDGMREQVKNLREKRTDSEHSDIEEGEIVGATERGRERVIERREVLLPSSSSPSYLQGSGPKPDRILRVLEGDGFVSVRADEEWEREPVASVGVGDLRRKLTSRRKERFRSCPSSASISPPSATVLSLPSPSFPTSPPLSPNKETSHKSSKSSKDRDGRKRKEGRGEKEKRKKRKEGKESGRGRTESKDRDSVKMSGRENKEKERDRGRSSRSDSRKRKRRRQSTPEHLSCSQSQNVSHRTHGRRSWSSHSEDHYKDRDREKEKERARDRNHEKDGDRDKWRDERDKKSDRDSRRRDGRKRDRDKDTRRSSSRERGSTRRSRGSSVRRDREKEMVRERDRDRRRDSRPVVPPSIQDLNGSDLFAIKRTITVTTTTTTTTVPGSPPLDQRHSRSRSQSSDKHHKRKKKRRRRSDDEEGKEEEHRSRSRPTSLTPPRYHRYESNRPEADMLSLDGEALDSDYPSLEDSPLLPPPPEPPLPSPRMKSTAPKASRHHLKKKSRFVKKVGQSESTFSSSSHRPKATSKNILSSLSPPLSASSGNTTSLQPTTSSSTAQRGRKTGKTGKKDSGRSGRSKKLSGSSRKGKLQSKVSVLVREGVSSTTGNSGKLGIELGSVGVVSGASGPSVVGGSIAVVFRRDNESRSPFLKPCSETLALPGRGKDLSKSGKQRNILGPPSSTNPSGLKSKKVKPSSATSTSSSASSPTSSLASKRRRRLGKKPREKGLSVDGSVKSSNSNSSMVGGVWVGVSTEMQPLVGVGSKPSSPPPALPGPTPSSSSSSTSSSASILPPTSSPPHTSPLSVPPSRDTRESSPDSQTVDSSCKTPEPSFLSEECPGQSKPLSLIPAKSPPSPPSLLSSQIRGDSISQSTSNAKSLLPDDQKASPPCSTSSSALVSASLSHSSAPLANDPSSSSSSSVSSSSVNKPPPPPPPPAPPLPWSLQTGVDCTAGGVLALTALLFKMEEANIASRAKAQEFIQATSQILSQSNQNQSQPHTQLSSSLSSQVPPPPPSHAPPPGPNPAQYILHSSVPLVGCTKTPPTHLHPGLSMGGGCAQTPPPPLPAGMSGATGGSCEMGWDNESKDPDKYMKKLHTQERAIEEVKLAIKPYYQRKDINKDEYKDILRKAVHKICHSRTGEINPVKVSNLVKLYVQRYKYFRKHGRKMDEEEKEDRESASMYFST